MIIMDMDALRRRTAPAKSPSFYSFSFTSMVVAAAEAAAEAAQRRQRPIFTRRGGCGHGRSRFINTIIVVIIITIILITIVFIIISRR